MARHFAVSKSHLCREARRLLGETVLQVAQRGKMEWSHRLMSDPNLGLSVSETAFRLGYADPLYFSKVFKRHHGYSPKFVRAVP
jgi:AraC-like DNA-binding protein